MEKQTIKEKVELIKNANSDLILSILPTLDNLEMALAHQPDVSSCAAEDQKLIQQWAEGVQSWFDTNRQNDDQHNHVDTRAELREYDPVLAGLLEEIYGDGEWRYIRPCDREVSPRLAGYDPAAAPRFKWRTE